MPRAIILGGGISGLSCAHYLIRKDSKLEVLLLEGLGRCGGTLGSERADGFVLERGPNGFLDDVPDAADLARDLGLGERLLRASPQAKNRFIYSHGRLHALPMGPVAFLRSKILGIGGRLRVLLEPFCGPGQGEDESVASFGRRRIGDEATRAFLDPLVSGIFAGDVERLSLPSAFPKLAEMEARHGSLFRALRMARRERSRHAPSEKGESASTTPATTPASSQRSLQSFSGGLEELVEALTAEMGDRIRKNFAATSIAREGKGYAVVGNGGAREAGDALILAVPAYRAATLLAAPAPPLSLSLEAVPYAPIVVVCLGLPRASVEHPLDGYGFLVPRDQGLRMLGTIWSSTIFPPHAPAGMVSLRCIVGGARDTDAIDGSDEALLKLVEEELKPILGLRAPPTLTRIYRYAKGIPQYNVGHSKRLEAIERELWSLPGLFLAGNAYRGVGINDCVREARRKARAVLEFLRR